MQRLILTLAVVFGLIACGRPAEPPAPAAEDDTSSDVIGAPLHQALDKANSVEDLNLGRKGELDDAIDGDAGAAE